ncbi:hypothetical protein CVT24_010970 [Panaeolus cyanescens]|uniref:F-box domain-containing protein n=1 Tax=Panaeolus cyanescens TaxID=181874 RepID=A0A409WE97_9AGAR|nr:hypothetical protein CVT24_010970 [Panaeolus cyanescens]
MSNLPNLSHPNSSQNDPVLPFELFARIIDDVASELCGNFYSKKTRADVISLSLVCHTFNELCRPHLFQLVEILDADDKSNERHITRQLSALLLNHPSPQRITSFIQHLTYSGYPTLNSAIGPELDNINQHNDFCHPLLQFPSVKTLYVTLHRRYPYSLCSDKSRLTISALFGTYIRGGTLTSLVLAQITELPILDLALCPNLHTLYLRRCTFSVPPQTSLLSRIETTTTTPFLPFSLRTCVARGLNTQSLILAILCVCPRLIDLDLITKGGPAHSNPLLEAKTTTCSVIFPDLKKLELCYTTWDYACGVAAQEGVKAFPDLRSLSLFITRESAAHTDDPYAILQHVQSLERLHIQDERLVDSSLLNNLDICFSHCQSTMQSISIVYNVDKRERFMELLARICSALETMGTGSRLETFDLEIHTMGHVWPDMHDFTQCKLWQRLDYILGGLGRKGRFEALKEVRVVVCTTTHGVQRDEMVWENERFRACFVELGGRSEVVLSVRIK